MLRREVVTILFVLVATTLAVGQTCTSDTGSNATLILPPGFQPTVDGKPVADSTKIRVLAPDGECVAQLTHRSSKTTGRSASIWGEDPRFNPGPGISPNAPLSFQLKPPTADTWYPATVTYAEDGTSNTTGKYSTDEFYIVKTLAVTSGDTPSTFRLRGNYPNPFNSRTTLVFELPARAEVRIEVFNSIGEEVMRFSAGTRPAGIQTLGLNASSLTSGLHIYRLTADLPGRSVTETGKMIVIK